MPFLPPGGVPWDREFQIEADDGVVLRAAIWNPGAARGHVLFLHGRTEFLEKVSIPAAALVERGFAVASLDWRGQGLSGRLADPAEKGHVADFTDYHRDLAALTAHPEVAGLVGLRTVLAHSMGATVALGAIDRRRLACDALILSAPMLGIRMARHLAVAASLTAFGASLAGRLDGWPPVKNAETPYVFQGFEDNVLTSDPAVFEWVVEALQREPRFQIAMPTIGWIREATLECRRVRAMKPPAIPAMILLGTAERVVDSDEIRRAAVRFGAKLAEIEGAEHEILLEAEPMRSEAWAAIDRFLEAYRL